MRVCSNDLRERNVLVVVRGQPMQMSRQFATSVTPVPHLLPVQQEMRMITPRRHPGKVHPIPGSPSRRSEQIEPSLLAIDRRRGRSRRTGVDVRVIHADSLVT